MRLADNPAGSGQNSQYELVADRVQLGINGAVSNIKLRNNQNQIAGFFTEMISVAGNGSGINAPGFGVWDIKTGAWVNSGGLVVGKMTFVGNESTSTQLLAGNAITSQRYRASGLLLLQVWSCSKR